MEALEQRLVNYLAKLQDESNFRTLRLPNHLIDFCSNDYLGFARRSWKEFREIDSTVDVFDAGSGGSRLLNGNSKTLMELEYYLQQFFDVGSALVFNSGYEANLGILTTFPGKNDVIFYDQFAHASLKDGCRLSIANSYSFEHNSIESLKAKIKSVKAETIFIVIESIYSMDGDIAPIKDFVNFAHSIGAKLIVDEAHATGVFGPKGEGLAHEYRDHIFARIATFGKAIGANGAAVLCSRLCKDYLINTCRQFIYTTAMSEWQAWRILLTFRLLEQNTDMISQLQGKIRRFQYNRVSTIKTVNQTIKGPIQSVIIPGNQECKHAALTLQKAGFDVRPILSPTVPKGSERLRICIHNFNTNAEIERLCTMLRQDISE